MLDVLSAFEANFVVAEKCCDGYSVDYDEDLTNQVPDKVATKG